MNKLAQIQSAIARIAKPSVFSREGKNLFSNQKPIPKPVEKPKFVKDQVGMRISDAIKSTNLSFNR